MPRRGFRGRRDSVPQKALLAGARLQRSVAEGIRTSVQPLYRPVVLYGALGVVVLSLIALIVVPVTVQREIDGLHEEMDHVADPAAQQVRELRYYTARQMALARGYALSGDPTQLARLEQMRDSTGTTLQMLGQTASRLSPAVAAELGAAGARIDAWLNALAGGGLFSSGDRPVPVDFERDAYEEALRSVDQLEAAIEHAAAERRTRIRTAERVQITTTVALGALALLSAALVFWLVHRVRRLAWRAERERLAGIRAAHARERLIRGVSHDLKNPLSVIDGYSELLELGLKGELTSDQRQVVNRIRATVGSLLTTVEELVDLSSAQAGLLRIERETVKVAPLLRELEDDYRSVAEGEGLRLVLEPPPDHPPLHADRRRVRQILENLIGNAIKYTPQGGTVTIAARERSLTSDQGGGHWLTIEVTDTGPGIPLDRQEAVFDEFVRLENAAGTTGSGVGLAMAQSLARLMGGAITVESEPGAGSRFTLWMPLRVGD